MENHGQKYQKHTEADGYHKHGIQFSEKRHIRHGGGGPQPKGRNHILKTKDTSEEKTKDGGADTCRADNGSKIDFLEVIQEKTAHCQAESLAGVSEHRSENHDISKRHKDGGIHLVV